MLVNTGDAVAIRHDALPDAADAVAYDAAMLPDATRKVADKLDQVVGAPLMKGVTPCEDVGGCAMLVVAFDEDVVGGAT